MGKPRPIELRERAVALVEHRVLQGLEKNLKGVTEGKALEGFEELPREFRV